MKLFAIAGSLRKASHNRALLGHAAPIAEKHGASVDLAELREFDIPLYDGDIEASSGVPDAVQRLKESIAGADGLLIVTPEYNNSMPGVLKNTIDWLSRPPADIKRVFGGRPVAIVGATPGQGGTRLSQAAWLPVVRYERLLPRPLEEVRRLLHVPAAHVVHPEGVVVDHMYSTAAAGAAATS